MPLAGPMAQGRGERPTRTARLLLAIWALALTTIPFAVFPAFPGGDLHSHLYNAWLVDRIERGELPGLLVAPQWTNTLVDWPLEVLLRATSRRATEAIVLAVLANLFVWPAFAFCRSLSRRPCWEWLPVLSCIALGWTFHMGFSNWFAAAGLALGAGAATLSRLSVHARAGLAVPAAAAAVVANPLPAAWIAAAVAVVLAARHRIARPAILATLAVVYPGILGLAVVAIGRGAYTRQQLVSLTGADQLMLFDGKYTLFAIALLVLWAWAAVSWRRSGVESDSEECNEPTLYAALFASACGVFLPDVVLFPGWAVPASFLAQRSSVFTAVAWTAVAARTSYRRALARASVLLSVGYVATAALDWASLSSFQRRLDAAVAILPRDARVVSAIGGPPSRVPPFTHALDLACVQRCFAWGNYEPSARQFRVRAQRENEFVVSDRVQFAAIEDGRYLVPALPFPLWKVYPCHSTTGISVCSSVMRPGETLRLECLDPFTHSGVPFGSRPCEANRGTDLRSR
jgi:hypothetical protein